MTVTYQPSWFDAGRNAPIPPPPQVGVFILDMFTDTHEAEQTDVTSALSTHKEYLQELRDALTGKLMRPYGSPAMPPTPDTPVGSPYKPDREITPTPNMNVRSSQRAGRGINTNVGRRPVTVVKSKQGAAAGSQKGGAGGKKGGTGSQERGRGSQERESESGDDSEGSGADE